MSTPAVGNSLENAEQYGVTILAPEIPAKSPIAIACGGSKNRMTMHPDLVSFPTSTYIMAPFLNGEGVLVTARGPGKVHLLSYQSNGKITAHIGAITTNNTGITRFLISHSYTFERFAFYWEGDGEAVFGYGQNLTRTPLGKSWKEAAMISWGQNLTTGDASANVAGAVNRDGAVTCFILPEYAI